MYMPTLEYATGTSIAYICTIYNAPFSIPVATRDVYANRNNVIEIVQEDFNMPGLKVELERDAIDKDTKLVFGNAKGLFISPTGYLVLSRPLIT